MLPVNVAKLEAAAIKGPSDLATAGKAAEDKMLSPAKAVSVGASSGGGAPPGRQGPSNADVKISGPNGVVLDMSQTGWIGN